jgi:hypothetical protein
MTTRTSRRWQVLALLLLSGWWRDARADMEPSRLSALELPAGVRAVDVATAPLRAYVLAKRKRGTSALYVLDTTAPSAPLVIGTLAVDRPASRLVAGRGAESAYLYVGTRGSPSELLVVDVSDATAPALVAAAPVGRAVTALARRGDRLYVGTRNDRRAGGRELRVLDVAVPSHPLERASVEVGAHVNDLAALDATLVAATSDPAREVVLFDVASEGAPVQASAIDLPGKSAAVAVAAESPATLAVVTDGGAPDFHLFQLTGVSPISRGTASLRTKGARVALRGDWAWVTSRRREGALRLLNLSHFSHPRVQRTYAARGTVGLAVDGPYAYLATRDVRMDLQIVDPGLPLRREIGDRNGDGVATVACLGDSNTDAARPGTEWCEQLARVAPTVVTVNEGRGGATAVDLPKWEYDASGQLDEALASARPDVVVLAFGTNDLRLAYPVDEVLAAYRDLATRAQQAGAFVLIALTPPVAPWFEGAATLNPLYALLNERLAAEWPADRLIDFASAVSAPGDYDADGIHFTASGHAKRALAAYTRLLFAD